MLNYENFKNLVMQHITGFLPEELQDSEPKLYEQKKVNKTVEGLTIRLGTGEYLPAIDMDELYRRYRACNNPDRVLAEAVSLLMEKTWDLQEHSLLNSYRKDGDGIFMMLINAETNRELLESVPHRNVDGNALLYRYAIGKTEKSIDSLIITDEIAEGMGLDETELFKIASVNTPKLFPAAFRSVRELIADFCRESGMLTELVEQVVSAVAEEHDHRWIITNDAGVYGAVYMLYTDVLDTLAGRAQDDLYLLPVSVNQVFAAPAGAYSAEQMIKNIEKIFGDIKPQERLSRRLYHYARADRLLSVMGENGLVKADLQITQKTSGRIGSENA